MMKKLFPRFFNPPKQSFFLFGPRGTGKSTLIRALYPEALWIDLLFPDHLRNYLARPERLFETVNAIQDQSIIVIDEIQKVPGLLSVVHLLIEQKRGLQFILTGSSARKLKRTGADLLGGRALRCTLHPFLAAEIGKEFQLENAVKNGMLPLLTNVEHPQKTLESYINLYLQEEIQAEGLVRNLENFARFLEVISFSHASILNVTNIARECVAKRKTVENYIEILEDLLLGWRLPVFTRKAKRELSVHPKFYLFDAGIYHTLRPRGLLDRLEEIEGAALEGLVAQHLMAWNDYSHETHDISFWRTRGGVEVDFIVYGPTGFWAIEVKNGTVIHPADTKPLEAFLSDYPMAKGMLLYRGRERLVQKGIICIPCEEFLTGLLPNQPLDLGLL